MTIEALKAVGAGADATASAPALGARQLWRRLRAQRAALAGGVVIVLLVLIAVAAPLLAGIEGQDTTTYHADLLDSAAGAVPRGSFGGISGDHWLGIEPTTGRDLFARLVYGSRVSLFVAVGATVFQVLAGCATGLAAGFGNRFVDGLLSQVADFFLVLPSLVFAIALIAVVPGGFPRPVLLMVVLGLFGWVGTSKIVRAHVLAHKTLDYVAASRLAGSSSLRTARRELLPSLLAPVLTYTTLMVPSNIVAEASLSFLGIGVTPPTPSWGQMLSTATTWYQTDPMYVVLPALLLFCTTLAFVVFAEGIRTALDPRAASRLRVGTGRARRDEAATATATATAAGDGDGGGNVEAVGEK